MSESCSSFASDDATAVGGETSEENGVKKTKRIIKVVRKVDAATIKREMRELEEKNGTLKDENIALQTLIQSLEEKCHTQEQKVHYDNLEGITHRFAPDCESPASIGSASIPQIDAGESKTATSDDFVVHRRNERFIVSIFDRRALKR